MAFKSFEDLEA